MPATPRRPDPAQLSLFVATEPTALTPMRPTPSAPTPPSPPHSPAPPTAALTSADSAILTPAAFHHPQAAREIVLGGHTVGYALKRVRRRSIGFIVGLEGLCVNVPNWVGPRDIETALREKASWILRKLHQQRERSRRVQAAKVDWRDGVTIPFLGQPVRVVLNGQAGVTPSGAVLEAGDGNDTPRRLHTGLPSGATPEQIRDTVQCWLQRQATRVFAERCTHYAAHLGVHYSALSLSSAQTRWGSASADGSIRLSWRLIHFGLSTIDYVVVHELAHLREMNHSPRFWDVVRSVVPDYQRTREVLKTELLPVFD